MKFWSAVARHRFGSNDGPTSNDATTDVGNDQQRKQPTPKALNNKAQGRDRRERTLGLRSEGRQTLKGFYKPIHGGIAMHQIAIVLSFGLGIAVFNAATLATENNKSQKQRLRVVLDADGNVEITPTTVNAQKSEKKLVITCERVQFKPTKKGQSSIEMVFIGAVRMVSRNSRLEAKRMTLSIPDGVRLLLKINRVGRIEK